MAAKKQTRRNRESPGCQDLLVMELQQIHSAESQLSRSLPRLVKRAGTQELQKLLQNRLEQGERLTGDVESALEELEASPGRRKNAAAEGLIADAREHAEEIESGPALDAVLVAGIQKLEHYCVAAWGTARSLAEALEQKAAVRAMEHALKEGKELDDQLTKLAEEEIMPQLLESGSDEEEDEDDSEEAEVEDDEEEEAQAQSRKRR